MRKWIAILLILPMFWAGYWIFGSYGLKTEISDWLTDRQRDGWQVETADIRVRGFPNRFDTTIDDIQLTDPDTGISWSAPFFQVLSLSYKPNHLIAVWPNTQLFSTPFQNIEIASNDMKASVVLAPNADMTLQRSTFIAHDFSMVSSLNWDVVIDAISTSIRQLDNAAEYEFSSDINSLRPSKNLREWLDEKNNLPAIVENVSVNFTTLLSSPLDRTTIEMARPQIKSLNISRAQANWGELLLRASGTLTANTEGSVSGELAINAKNWREMLQLAVSAGAISADVASAAEFGLGLIARLSGSENTLDTTLTFKDGRMFLGPIPLGTAPKLILR